jgi:hypothetical protein
MTADLQGLISDNAVENVRLELKSAIPNKDELLKKLSSFANTFGGILLIGAKADSKDGRIQDLPQVCYVIFVAESDVAPHFLNNRKGVWVRTDEFSARFDHQLADENELKHLLDRRRLVRERRLRLV